mgnify:CR=1 FL=1|jgi:hypothetical protein
MITLKLKNAEALALQQAAWRGVTDMAVATSDLDPQVNMSDVRLAEAAAQKLNDAVAHLPRRETAPAPLGDDVDPAWHAAFTAELNKGIKR